MHSGSVRRNPLVVDFVFLNACMGYISTSTFDTILGVKGMELSKKMALIRALGKVFTIQTDMFAKFHQNDYVPEQEEGMASDVSVRSKQRSDREGSVSTVTDDAASTFSVASTSTGKTSLGRPVEEADHLKSSNSPRCPFSGLAADGLTRFDSPIAHGRPSMVHPKTTTSITRVDSQRA